MVLAGKLPPTLFRLFMQQLRLKPLRRLPVAFGWLTKRGDAATARWLQPVLRQPAIRRDTVHVLRSISAGRDLMLQAAGCLPAFDRPALVVWAQQDRVMPPEHGRRLAELLPQERWWRYPTATRCCPLISPPTSPRPSRNSPGGDAPRVLMAPRRGCPSGRASLANQYRRCRGRERSDRNDRDACAADCPCPRPRQPRSRSLLTAGHDIRQSGDLGCRDQVLGSADPY